MSNEDDPLEGVEVGDSVHYNTEYKRSVYDLAFDDLVGWDREIHDVQVADAEIVGEDGNEELRVQVEGELTKQERPDHVPNPEEREERQARRERRCFRQRIISHAVAFVVMGVVTYATLHALPREMSFVGESVAFDPTGMWLTMMAIFAVVFTIIVGLHGGLPGKVMDR